MKRLFLSMLCAATALASFADDVAYPYLVFTASDGTQTVVAVNQLEITFSDGQLVATNATGTQTKLTLQELASMQFSTAADLPTGIQTMGNGQGTMDNATFYDLSGRRAYRASEKAPLRKGVYVVRKADGSTTKIAVK